MAPSTEKGGTDKWGQGEERQQESVDEGYHQHEFEAIMPKPEARAFHSEFSFGEAEDGFDLPAAGVSKHNTPGIIDRRDRFVGEQIPGFTARARTGDNQPQWVIERGQLN
jgi:hypothetical protein